MRIRGSLAGTRVRIQGIAGGVVVSGELTLLPVCNRICSRWKQPVLAASTSLRRSRQAGAARMDAG